MIKHRKAYAIISKDSGIEIFMDRANVNWGTKIGIVIYLSENNILNAMRTGGATKLLMLLFGFVHQGTVFLLFIMLIKSNSALHYFLCLKTARSRDFVEVIH
ncbi:hypothetical protein JXJ21_17170 [candidate division KSB1 bacterium]|nr:hypothetical protein [candidate division KSB1 bacterium]